MKLCTRCRTAKDESEFGRRADRPDGLNGWCKPCNVAANRESRSRHPETAEQWERDNRPRRRLQKAAHMRRVRQRQREEVQ